MPNQESSFEISPNQSSEEESEAYKEEIEDGIWKPSIFKDFEDSLAVGASTKELKRIIGREDARIRITADRGRFDQDFSKEEKEKRIAKLGAGRILIHFLKRIAPEADSHRIEKTGLEHSDQIAVIDQVYLSQDKKDRAKTSADGMVTNLRDIPLMVAAADCAPVGIYDPENQAIGVFHSGWRGTLKQISPKGVEKMREVYGSNPEKLLAVIGPHADGERFEVGEDVYDEFLKSQDKDDSLVCTQEEVKTFFKPNKKKPGHYFFDSEKAIKASLIKAGILPENIQVSQYSTMSEKGNALFPSERLEGKEERDSFAFIMALRKAKENLTK